MDAHYLPNVFLVGGKYKKIKGATMIYVCQNKVCQMPTEELAVALKQLQE